MVLGHERCGAVASTVEALRTGERPDGGTGVPGRPDRPGGEPRSALTTRRRARKALRRARRAHGRASSRDATGWPRRDRRRPGPGGRRRLRPRHRRGRPDSALARGDPAPRNSDLRPRPWAESKSAEHRRRRPGRLEAPPRSGGLGARGSALEDAGVDEALLGGVPAVGRVGGGERDELGPDLGAVAGRRPAPGSPRRTRRSRCAGARSCRWSGCARRRACRC